MDAALPLFLLVMGLAKKAQGPSVTITPEPPRPPRRDPRFDPRSRRTRRGGPLNAGQGPPSPFPPSAPVQPIAWPQVVPAGLPAFPGPGWAVDSPPGSGVVARAHQLLPALWRGGAGTFKTEQTNGRWVTYRATQMGLKRGVVAYRLVEEAPTLPVTPPPSSSPSATVPASVPEPVVQPVNTPPVIRGVQTLRRGSSGPTVVVLQRMLGIPDDGKFGPGTDAAVRAFQARKGLTVDGVVGPQTWGALTTGGAQA